jgi:hypothetical protein
MPSRSALAAGAVIVGLLLGVVALQAARERHAPLGLPAGDTGNLLYVRSAEIVKRAALSYDSIVADVYWMRTVQHYGRTKLSNDPRKQYDILFPLLDLTTSLDPSFNIAYRYGAIFLSEPPPAGPGRPDQAVALLQKGLRLHPDRWEFAQDIGFTYYWWENDYARAAEWFTRASRMPGAPNWMAPLAAVTISEGGSRETSRRMWKEILAGAKEQWLRDQGEFRLRQLDALDQIDALAQLVERYRQQTGSLPESWQDLIRARHLPGVPIDSERRPFVLNPTSGAITLDPQSPLNPLPSKDRARPQL